ncbi:phage baseplate assembly protein [Photobacterium arenosum]|uniref:phage baseplate assembly protein n=1 Tax=Photobacterium arenosum TaxID=2774143 RepID=UPI00288C3D96|nr:contractile injection system protein, VgrG/Pvc8 family [Photobacterium arenosum]
MDKVTLSIGNRQWQGWQSVNITRSLGAVTGEYRISLTQKWRDAERLPIKEGMAVKVIIGNEVLATGYVAERLPSYDGKSINYEITCRDKTKDLVESSVLHASGEWKDINLQAMAKEICAPYGIGVVVETDIGAAFTTIRLEQGESGFELLERLSRQRGVLLTSDANGNLVLTRGSKSKLATRLELGKNILAARGRFSEDSRFNQYIVKGVADALDGWEPSQVSGNQVVIKDNLVQRYRPKIIITEEVFTAEGASRRGQWQRQRAIGQSFSSEITVQGWRMPDGQLWPLNRRVDVVCPIQELNHEMLISTVTFIEDDNGRVTVLNVVPPEAMDIPPEKAKPKDDTGWLSLG